MSKLNRAKSPDIATSFFADQASFQVATAFQAAYLVATWRGDAINLPFEANDAQIIAPLWIITSGLIEAETEIEETILKIFPG